MNTINNEGSAASNFKIRSGAAVPNTAPNRALSLLRSAFTTASQRGQYIVGKKRSCSSRQKAEGGRQEAIVL